MIYLLVFGSLGPYLPVLGLRVDQAILYTVLLPVLMMLALDRTFRWHPGVLVASASALLLIVVSVFAGLLFPGGTESFDLAFLAGIENYTKIVGLLAVGLFLSSRDPNAVRKILTAAIAIGSFNVALSAVSTIVDIWPLVSWFKGEHAGETWRRSLDSSRHLGLLDAPSQAGILYSLSLVFLLIRRRLAGGSWGMVVAGMLWFSFGAWLAQTKAFVILVAIGFLAAIAAFSGSHALRVEGRLASGAALGLVSGVVVAISALMALTDPQGLEQYLGYVTGNRLAVESSPVLVLVVDILSRAPILGLGPSVDQPVDGGFLLFFLNAGFVGLLAGFAMLVGLAWALVQGAHKCGFGHLGLAMAAMVFAGEVATPVVTRPVLGTVLLLTVSAISCAGLSRHDRY